MTELMSGQSLYSATNDYLILHLGDAVFGIDVSKIKELTSWVNVTRIPNEPDYVCGLRNIRGTIVPVMDLRLRLEMPAKTYDMTTVVILLEVIDNGSEIIKNIGLAVDAVSEARQIDEDRIKPAPDFDEQLSISYIKGLSEIDDKLVTLLDTDILFSIEALA